MNKHVKCETPDSNDLKVIAKVKGFRYMYVGQRSQSRLQGQ